MAKTGKIQVFPNGKRLILPSGKCGVLINEDDCCPCGQEYCCEAIGPAASMTISGLNTDLDWANGTWSVSSTGFCRYGYSVFYSDHTNLIRTFTNDGWTISVYKKSLVIDIVLASHPTLNPTNNYANVDAVIQFKYVKAGVTGYGSYTADYNSFSGQPCEFFSFDKSQSEITPSGFYDPGTGTTYTFTPFTSISACTVTLDING